MFRPTKEQRTAVAKFRTGRPLKIVAFAGSGKTSTLRLLAEANTSRGIYVAFNKSIADEAAQKFPANVVCRTIHSLAYRAIMPSYDSAPKLTNSLRALQLAEVMDFKDILLPGPFRLERVQQAHLVLGTVRRFCQSAAAAISGDHVPRYGRLLVIPDDQLSQIRSRAVSQATALWARMIDRRDDVPLGHDGYLKLWALGRPVLPFEYVLLDEAQDTNAVVLDVLSQQEAQIVYVGDRHQQIYEWRGAVNAMEKVVGCEEALLTQSFRFGESIASAASQVLSTLGERQRLRGNPSIASTIDAFGHPVAVLARTNGTVVLEVLEAMAAGKTPCVVGGTQDLKRLLGDVYKLKAGQAGSSPEFFGFDNWSDIVSFADTEEGEDLGTFVRLVEKHGEDKLWAAVKGAQDGENGADIILSTAHKAKGREWDAVRLAPDFASARLGPDPSGASEVRLFYVAMTRAKRSLIVDPKVLATFATNAWKANRPQPQRTEASSERSVPRDGIQPSPSLHSTRPVAIREVNSHAIRTRHPGAVGAVSNQPPGTQKAGDGCNRPSSATTDQSAPKHGTFWKRVARLFGSY